MKNKMAWLIIVGIGITLTLSAAGFAEPLFTVKPKLDASYKKDNNFYRSDTEDNAGADVQNSEREVTSYLIQPGIMFGAKSSQASIMLNYTLDSYSYDDGDLIAGEEETDDYIGHTGVLQARYRATGRTTLGLDESLNKTRDPGQSDANTNESTPEKYTINRLTPSLSHQITENVSTMFRYQNTETAYSKSTLEDSSEHKGIVDLTYMLNETISLTGEYQYWERDYNMATANYCSQEVDLIMKKQFNYLTAEGGVGYQDREFDTESVNDMDTFTYKVGISGQMPEAPEKAKSYMSLFASQNFNDQGIGNSYYTTNKLTLAAGHVFMERVPLNINGSYQNSDYETETGLSSAGITEARDDDTYTFSGDIGYMVLEDLTISVGAGYEERNSNILGRDYNNEFVMAKAAFEHKMGE
ncbi:MAG: outer membrane beta-barrel protein [Pseudomonadota bacterium]